MCKKIIFSLFIFSLPLHAERSIFLPSAISLHNSLKIRDIFANMQGECRDLKNIVIGPKKQRNSENLEAEHGDRRSSMLKKEEDISAGGCDICGANMVLEGSGALHCTDKCHVSKVLCFYGKEFAQGFIDGAQSFIFLHYLYSLGVPRSCLQVGINLVSNEIVRNSPLKLRSYAGNAITWEVQASLIKRGVKLGLTRFGGLASGLVYEPHKMRSFFMGTLTHNLALMNKELVNKVATSGKLTPSMQAEESMNKKLLPHVAKLAGAAVGAYVAYQFMEEPLYAAGKFLAEQTKDLGFKVLEEIVSFTK